MQCDPYSVIYLSWSTIVICGSYLSTLILSRLSIKALHQDGSQFSGRTKRLQAQFTRTLAYQTVLPLFFSIIPMNIIVFTTFMNIDTESLGTIMMSSISYIPLFNSLTTICCIKTYRQEVCGLLTALTFAKPSLTSVIHRSSGPTRGVSITVT
ncbi:Seven TM Receptor [Aphelenchoides besseyi]|nr:Seven TM Receptor [Aphelenchoides besseyi]